jgi:hypothetical protein
MSNAFPVAAFATAVTGIALVLIRQFSARRCEREAAKFDRNTFSDQVFPGSWWNYLYAFFSIPASLFCFYFAGERVHAQSLAIFLGVFFLICGGLLAWGNHSVSGVFCDGHFFYRVGRKTAQALKLQSIRHVRVSDGLLIVDTGESVQKKIPMIFENCPKMLAMLRYYRPRTEATVSKGVE